MESVGRYEIEVYESFTDDSSISFKETVTVDVLDPCGLAKVSLPSSFDATYDEAASEIRVSWSEFGVKPDDGHCPPVGVSFTVKSSGADAKASYDLEAREATIKVPELTETTTFDISVTEAINAVN